MNKVRYFKLVGNNLQIVTPMMVRKGSRSRREELPAEDYAKIGAYPRDEQSMVMPKLEDGYRAVADGYELREVGGESSSSREEDNIHSPTPTQNSNSKKWVRKWRVEAITYTYDDYDNAMEDYIHQVAVDRGYTRREPSSYKDDPYPRFAQDAEDYIAFRSAVMLYALPILNEYLETGKAPSLAEFKAGFPKIVWSSH